MTVSQTDVHSERIDEPTLPEVWLRDVETTCYSSVLMGQFWMQSNRLWFEPIKKHNNHRKPHAGYALCSFSKS